PTTQPSTESRNPHRSGREPGALHDEWAEGRRYLGLDVLARAQAVDTTLVEEEVTAELELQALTA
ncbi:hypothetical protein ACFQ3F_25375, partial [Nocardioides ginsengisoli]